MPLWATAITSPTSREVSSTVMFLGSEPAASAAERTCRRQRRRRVGAAQNRKRFAHKETMRGRSENTARAGFPAF